VTADRQMAIELIEEAVSAGARRHKACSVLEITVRTLQRWQRSLAEDQLLGDQRKVAAAERLPANKLTEIERRCILAISNSQDYRSLPPSQIVPRLADEGEYMASESTFYRVLREADQVNRRGRAKPPRTLNKPQGYKATGPNQVWSWDITFLASTIRGAFYRLYMLMDIYSRKMNLRGQ
jgi:putative transposase